MNTPVKDNTRDDKKSLVLDAGIKVLREKGISKTSMNDIIRESGLSKGGVYHYFSSKDELLIALFNYFFEKYAISNIERLQSDNDIQELSAYKQIDILIQHHEAGLDDMGEDMSLMMDLYIEAIHNPAMRKVFNQQYQLVFSIIKSLIEQAQQQGDVKKEINSTMISASLLAVFDGFGLAHQVVEDANDYPRMALDAARLILDGVSNR